MPRPCVELEEEKQSEQETISHALVKVVKQGLDDGRVVCGVQACLALMNSDADSVMLCLLMSLTTVLAGDLNIFLLLIQDLCRNKDIPHIQIMGQQNKMALLLAASSQSAKCRHVDIMPPPQLVAAGSGQSESDVPGCLMIKLPKGHTSKEDDMVISYIKQNLKDCKEPQVPVPQVSASGMDTTMGFKVKTKKVKLVPSSSLPF